MTAALPENPLMAGVRSLEVRWILPGQLEATVAGWFARFPAVMEAREDSYLLQPQFSGLSVKIRGSAALDVKAYVGSPGILDVAGRARGRMESWQKWSFPCAPLSQDGADPPGWTLVGKRRRVSRFPLTSGRSGAWVPGPGEEPRCGVEITEVRTSGEEWWSLGFEATGPADRLHGELEATAALVFADDPPGGVSFSLDHSRSYTEWLRGRAGGG